MKLTNEKLIKILSKCKQTLSVENYYKGLIFNSVEINKIILDKKNIIQNLQYLSLSNNNITHIDFIIHLQNLYYLDITNNPIIEFEPLNIKNIFGFLSLIIENYHEKKILQIKGLNVGIMKMEIENKHYIKPFLIYNPNIIELNGNIVYYKDILAIKENKKTTKFSTRIKLAFAEDAEKIENENKDNTKIEVKNKGCYVITNENLIKLIQFLKIYSERLTQLFGNRASMKYLINNEIYNELERMKLIELSSVYHDLIKYIQFQKIRNYLISQN